MKIRLNDAIGSCKGGETCVLQASGETQTLTLRVQADDRVKGEVIRLESSHGLTVHMFFADVSGEEPCTSLMVEFYTNVSDKPLVLTAPWATIPTGNHEIIVRYHETNLELFIDGVLMDEDWPYGAVSLEKAQLTASVSVMKAHAWDRSITDEEIYEWSGGASKVRELEAAYLGAEINNSLQYWRPRGHNTAVGDCMPFYDGTRFHVYYLFDRKAHRSKWRLGAHQWAHVSTKDLLHWEHHPLAVGITHDWEGSICTGSFLYEDGTYYAFYSVRMFDRSPAKLTWAISQDGIHFTKTDTYIALSNRYTLSSVRDPEVYKDSEGIYHMLVTTSLLDVDGESKNGCLAHLTSLNLIDWEEAEPYIVPGYYDEPECSNRFEWNGWHYLIFSNHGAARYRMSQSPDGPWLRPASDMLDCPQFKVPKTAQYDGGKRRLAAGFLSIPGRYAGQLIMRELVQHQDGTLGLKFVEELVPPSAGPMLLGSPLDTDNGEIVLSDINGFAEWRADALPCDYRLQLEIVPSYPHGLYGISVGCTPGMSQGWDVRFEPSSGKVGVHEIKARSWQEDEQASIYGVEGLAEETVRVDMIVRGDLVDLCINDSRTLISKITSYGTGLRFFSQFGEVKLKQISVCPLK